MVVAVVNGDGKRILCFFYKYIMYICTSVFGYLVALQKRIETGEEGSYKMG